MNHLTALRRNSLLGLHHICRDRLAKGVASLITALFNGPTGDLNGDNKHPVVPDPRSFFGLGLDEDQKAPLYNTGTSSHDK